MKGTKEDVKRQKHSQTSDEGCVPSSQESHPSSSLILCIWCENNEHGVDIPIQARRCECDCHE